MESFSAYMMWIILKTRKMILSYLAKAEESSLSYYLPIAGGRIIGFIPISAMWNAVSLVQDLNSCRRVHFLRR